MQYLQSFSISTPHISAMFMISRSLRNPLVSHLSLLRRASTSHRNNMALEFPSSFTHYQVLGIPPSSDETAIKKSFRSLSKKFHPDMSASSATSNKQVVKANYLRIITAYKVLIDASARKKYDHTINVRTFNKRSAFTNSSSQGHHGHKTYSSGGINQTRNKVWFGSSRSVNKGSSEDNSTYTGSGSNYDVPHFSFDDHLRGTLWFEQRMINKRLNQQARAANGTAASDHISSGASSAREEPKFRDRKIEDEIRYTMSLHRFGTHQMKSQPSGNHNNDHTHQFNSGSSHHRHRSAYSYSSGFSIHSGTTTTVVLVASLFAIAMSSVLFN